MLLAFILCFSTLPMTAFAQDADVVTEQEADSAEEQEEQQEAVPVTEQKEAEAAAAPGEETPADKSTTAGEAPDTVKPSAESVSDNDAGTQDTAADDEKKAAVQKVQALIDALPETVTEDNAESVGEQLEAIAEAMESLTEEQIAELDMEHLYAISEAMSAPMTVAEGEHEHCLCDGGDTCNRVGGHYCWKATFKAWTYSRSLPSEAGYYYLTEDVRLSTTWTPKNNTVLCLNGHSITVTADNVNAITLEENNTFTLTDCNGSNSTRYFRKGSKSYGGQWESCEKEDSAFTVEGGVITHEPGKEGYGVWAFSKATGCTFNMYGGTICGNYEWGGGGSGVNILYHGKCNLYGGAIRGNGTRNTVSGGVHVADTCSFNMYGGSISDNTAYDGSGGGVYNGGSFNMYGGNISNNTCTNDGGGVYNAGTFTMTGGSITGNTRTGSDDNTSTGNGGGVYLGTYSSLSLSGTPVISDNWDAGGKVSNVYYKNSKGKPITITDVLEEGAKIGVTLETVPVASPVYIAKFSTDMAVENMEACVEKFTSDASGYNVVFAQEQNGDCYIAIPPKPHRHFLCGGDTCTKIGHNCETETEFEAWTQTTELPNTAGNYYLTDDVTLSTGWQPAEDIVLCLNGHSITAAAEEAAIIISKTFTLTDCNDSEGKHYFKNDTTRNRWVPCGEDDKDGFCVEGGVITHSADGAVNGVDVKGTFIIYGGTICGHSTDSNSENNGAGVVVRSGSKFEMYGGAIRGNGNTGVTNGGGVYAYKDTSVIMTGGTISDNSVGYGSGLYIDGGTFTMTGGTISGNTAAYGSGLYIDGGALNMTGGTISGNKATCGSGVYMKNNAIINLSGTASISGNKATSEVGGVYIWAGTLNMTGGSISGNTADKYGGVYLDRDGSATFNLSGTSVISGNQDTNGMASNVYVYGYYDADSTGNPINITGALEEGAKIGVSPNYVPNDSPVYIAKFPTNMSENDRESCAAKFTADARSFCASAAEAPDSAYYVAIQPEHHEHYICGGDECTQIGGHSCEAKTEFKAWTSTTSLPDTAGNWYLTDNVTLSKGWEPKNGTVLCLNGCTITSTTNRTIIVGKDTTFTLCDDRGEGKIGSTSYGSIGLFVNGKFNLYNGLITSTGGDASKGAYVTSDGTFTMYGGSITGNKNLGVRLTGGTFTMYDGSITGNGNEGVSMESGSNFVMKGGRITQNMRGGVKMTGGTFDMSGNAEISDNTDKTSTVAAGGVCMNSNIGTATFNMSGDAKIINNNVTGNGVRRDVAGGLLVEGNAKISISGNVQITGNKWNGKENNVLLWTERYLDIDSKLEPTARIGVDTLYEPADMPSEGVEIVASGANDDKLDYTRIFTPDATDNNYEVIRKDSKLYLKVHQHSWNYTAKDDNTITAACACGEQGGSVTIAAPEESTLTYDGKAKEATLNSSLPDDVTAPTITYKDKNGTESSTAPTNAGPYTASIKLGDATASVTYEIEKATPSADDFTFTAPGGSLIYDGNAQPATVDVNGDIKGMGEIVAVKYYQDEKEVQEPINAGTYKVKIDVTAGINYKAVNSLTSDDWTFTIERNPNAPVVVLNDGTSYNYTGEPIQPAVTVTVGGKELENGKDYTVTYDGNVNVGDGTVIITAKGNYAFAKDTEHFTIVQAKQTLNFEKDAVNTTYGDAPFTNALAKTSTYFGTITYSSDNTAVATVDGSTGQVTIVGAGTASITATAAATTNYKEGSASYTLTVNKALLVVNGAPVVQAKYYDGTADAVVTVSFADGNNALLKLKPTTDYTVTGTFSSPNASTSKQEVSIKIELKGDYAKNYELKKATYTAYAYIHAKPISIVSATAVGREYEKGNTSVTIDSVDFDGVVTAAPLVKGTDYTATGEMDDANAGTKNVTVTVTLLKDAANNYIFDNGNNTFSTTVEISKATPEITGATTQQIMKNGVAVDISKWVSFNNTDSEAELEYELLYSPEGITLNGSKLTAANNDTTVESFAIKVTAKETPNFTSAEKTITVDVVDKMLVGIIFKEPVKSNTVYGDPDFSLTADFDPDGTVPAEGDNGTWEWESSNPDVLKIISGGDTTTPTIKVLKAGKSFLTVTYTSDTYSGGPNGVSITVNPKAIIADMIGNIDAQEYTGKDIEPTPEVKDGTTKLTNDTDFTYSYSNNRNAGTATLTITGKGNYEGEVTKEFTISPKSIDGASIELANKSFAYTGSEQTVNITSVKLSDGTILGTDDYVIKDNSNKATNAGEITLTIEGKGNYTGTATTTWAITKAVPKLADFDVVPDLSNELTYSGEKQIVNVTTKAGIRGMGMITVRYNDSTERPVNAGNYAITIDVADGSNYKAISGIEAGTLTIKKAAAPTLADVKVDHAYATTGNQTVSLAELVKSAKSYAPGEITGNMETEILSDINVTGDGVLQYTLTGNGAAGSTVTIPVTIASTNYEETTVNVVITIKQATPTGAPGYEFIHDSSKTLKDAGLDLINSTLNPKEGTLEWIDSNGKVLPGETKLEEGKKYIWRFTPDNPNYATITGELELYAPYRILDGADSTWTQSTDGTIAIRGNGDFEKFQSVKVDGIVVDAKYYTVAKGSTIITFKEDYLKTLSTGNHTFELIWTDGSATTKFTIAAKPDNGDNNNSDNNNNDKNDDSDNDTVVIGNVSSGNNTVPAAIGAPKTGDASGIWMTLFAVSLAGLAAMLVRKKNNRE